MLESERQELVQLHQEALALREACFLPAQLKKKSSVLTKFLEDAGRLPFVLSSPGSKEQSKVQAFMCLCFCIWRCAECRADGVGSNQLKHASPDSTEKTAQLADRIAPWSRAQVNSVTLCLCDLGSTLEGGTLESRGFPQER